MRILGLTAVLMVLSTPSLAQNALYDVLAQRSHPSDPARVSLFNPWGENLRFFAELPVDLSARIVTAAQVYNDQNIRFDGYVGSDDDGSHYGAAADGEDGAYYGNPESATYRVVYDGIVDDTRERVWVCLDYPIHAVTLAGFPLRQAMAADFQAASPEYTLNGREPFNRPVDDKFFRRVPNLRRYFERRQFFSPDYVSVSDYFDPDYRPLYPYEPGDVLFMGHYGDADKQGPWRAKHSGIVKTVDERGLPVELYNMRVSRKMIDEYGGVINHTRSIDGEEVFFKRYCDRYSLIGHGRIVNAFVPAARDEDSLALAGEE